MDVTQTTLPPHRDSMSTSDITPHRDNMSTSDITPHRDNMSTSDIRRVLESDSDLQVDIDTQDIKGTEGGDLTVCDVMHIKPENSLEINTKTCPFSSDNSCCNMEIQHDDGAKSEEDHKLMDCNIDAGVKSELDTGTDVMNRIKQDDDIQLDMSESVEGTATGTHRILGDSIKHEDGTQHAEYNHLITHDDKFSPTNIGEYNGSQSIKSEPSSPVRLDELPGACDVLLCVDKLQAEDQYDNIYPHAVKTEDEQDIYDEQTVKNSQECSQTTLPDVNSNPEPICSHSDTSHTCTMCNKIFTQASYLKEHMDTHSAGKPHRCTVCEKRFNKLGLLKLHLLYHSGEKTHSCTVLRTTEAGDVQTHTMTQSVSDKPYCCKQCNERFTQEAHLKEHMLIHPPERLHRCPLCDKIFMLARNRDDHVQNHCVIKPYSCAFCQEKFTTITHLNNHMLGPCGKKQLSCTFCKMAVPAVNIDEHMRVLCHKRTYSCKFCDRTFKYSFNLEQHLKSYDWKPHAGKRKAHCCTVCNTTFTCYSQLKQHMLTHPEDRSYACKLCPKAFKLAKYPDTHMLTHTQRNRSSSKHRCSKCGASFRRVCDLNRHMPIHMDDKPPVHVDDEPHSCTVCGELNLHKIKHYDANNPGSVTTK